MHWKSDNIKIMIRDEADEVIQELFDLPKGKYQNILKSMRSREFVLNNVHLLWYKCFRINFNRGRSFFRFLCLDKKWKSNDEFHQ